MVKLDKISSPILEGTSDLTIYLDYAAVFQHSPDFIIEYRYKRNGKLVRITRLDSPVWKNFFEEDRKLFQGLTKLLVNNRCKILILLNICGNLSVIKISRRLNMSYSTIYAHLEELKEVGLIWMEPKKGRMGNIVSLLVDIRPLSELKLERINRWEEYKREYQNDTEPLITKEQTISDSFMNMEKYNPKY